MKQKTRHLILMPIAAALFAAVSLPGFAAAVNDAQWRPAVAWESNGSNRTGGQDIAHSGDMLLLTLGRSVYVDLQRAMQAALSNNEITNVRVALQEARDALDRLLLPSETEALDSLDARLPFVSSQPVGTGTPPGADLWVPVGAQGDDIWLYAPARAGAGTDRTGPPVYPGAKHLNVVTSSTQYSLGVFPLQRVSRYLESARASANSGQPDLAAVRNAVQRALAAFQWYGSGTAPGPYAIYDDVADARVVAAGPGFRADRATSDRLF
jgi:hypothetical protein